MFDERRPVDHENKYSSGWRLQARGARDRFFWSDYGKSKVSASVRGSCTELAITLFAYGVVFLGTGAIVYKLVLEPILNNLADK